MNSYIEKIKDYQYSNPLTLFYCGHENCKPCYSYGPAIRPHYLVHFILKGKGIYYEGGNTHTLSAGNGFLITPGQTTTYRADLEDPWEYCWIGFDGYEAKTILKNCGLSEESLIFHIKVEEVRDCLLTLVNSFRNQLGNEYTYLSYLYQCFSFLKQNISNRPQEYTETYLKKAIEYLHQNYSYPIQIGDVAQHIGIDRTYLYKLFMQNKKISPKQYLIIYRLQVACHLLKETELSISEIAYSCGFHDGAALSRHFKNKYRISPMAYRKS
jgi:AraC-like DNA-binding protein